MNRNLPTVRTEEMSAVAYVTKSKITIQNISTKVLNPMKLPLLLWLLYERELSFSP